MRNVVVSEFMSLDGVMEALNVWRFPFWHEGMGAYKYNERFHNEPTSASKATPCCSAG